jgi:hypothetical protein
MIADEVGFSGSIVWDTTKPDGQPRRCLDVTTAKALFGFQAEYRLREGIPKTVQWFLANRGGLHGSCCLRVGCVFIKKPDSENLYLRRKQQL